MGTNFVLPCGTAALAVKRAQKKRDLCGSSVFGPERGRWRTQVHRPRYIGDRFGLSQARPDVIGQEEARGKARDNIIPHTSRQKRLATVTKSRTSGTAKSGFERPRFYFISRVFGKLPGHSYARILASSVPVGNESTIFGLKTQTFRTTKRSFDQNVLNSRQFVVITSGFH